MNNTLFVFPVPRHSVILSETKDLEILHVVQNDNINMFSPEQSIHRSELKPYARSYAENLSAQVVRLLRDSDVKTVPAFEEQCRQRLVPTERVRKMQALLAQLNEIRKTGIAPALEDVHFEEHGPDGEEIELDLQETLDESRNFFSSHNLPELARALPAELRITPKNLERIRAAMRQGFDRAFFLPRTHVQLEQNENIVNEFMMKLRGSVVLSTVDIDQRSRSAAPQRRPRGKSYLVLYHSGWDIRETEGKKPGVLLSEFLKKGWYGFTLQEFLTVGMREHDDCRNFAFGQDEQWLLDSKSVNLYPNAEFGQYAYTIHASAGPEATTGARPTVIVELE